MKEIEKAIKNQQDGTSINVFVSADTNQSVFPAGYDEWRKTIKINVSSPAKDNRANIEILKTVAKFFDKSIQDVFIVSGEKSKEKTILIKEISAHNVINKLQESLNGL
jgi:uncharacterized protein (TIGR00251 family)